MKLKPGSKIFMVGIKGVGMTALALYLKDMGFIIEGSDTDEVFVTDNLLHASNIKIHPFSYNIQNTIYDFLIYTGAHNGADHPQVKLAQEQKIPVISLAEAQGEFTRKKKVIAICGVGGKTTTTAMLAHVLNQFQLNPSWLVGSAEIPSLPAPGHFNPAGEWCVVEADEYVTSPQNNLPRFQHLKPEIIICTNLQYDHPDAYPSLALYHGAYQTFFESLPRNGILIINAQDQALVNLVQGLKNLKSIELIKLNFDDYSSIKQNLIFPGQHNFHNACFTSVVAQKLGLDPTQINQALSQFIGLKRRFELIQEKNQIKYYDDYAHHPYEITKVLQACRELTNGQVIAIFEPHTYSRTKVLFDDFANSFSQAHQVILLPIFPSARERPDPTVSSLLLSQSISNSHHAASYQEAANLIKQLQKPGDLVITLGAGNIYRLHQLL